MKKNVGGADRTFRWLFGGSSIIGGLFASGWARAGLLGVGAIALASAAMQKCACNAALGVNTYENEEEESEKETMDSGIAQTTQAT